MKMERKNVFISKNVFVDYNQYKTLEINTKKKYNVMESENER